MPVFVSRATSSVAVPVDLAMSACFATFADRLKAVSGSETGKAFGERRERLVEMFWLQPGHRSLVTLQIPSP